MFIPLPEYLIFSPYLIVDDVVIVFALTLCKILIQSITCHLEYFMLHLVNLLLRPIFRAGCRSSWQDEVAPGRCGTYKLSKSVISLAIFEDSFLAHDYKVVKYTN